MREKKETIRLIFTFSGDSYRYYTLVTENYNGTVTEHCFDFHMFINLVEFTDVGDNEMIWEEYIVSPAKPANWFHGRVKEKTKWRLKKIRIRRDFQFPHQPK
jgi:hypothetical protein